MLERFAHSSGLVAYRSPRLDDCGVPHVFTTRVGGAGRELCVSEIAADDRAALFELAGFAAEAAIHSTRQVHGDVVHRASESGAAGEVRADAVVSANPAQVAMVYAADCVPVVIAAPGGATVAAIHAGWRGLVAGVIERAVTAAGARGGVAAVGPCLSGPRCEMGPEVLEQFRALGFDGAILPAPDLPAGRARLDVRAVARAQLLAAGIEAVDVSDRCTWGNAEEFPSHRRDVTHGGRGRTARLGALIAPAAPGA